MRTVANLLIHPISHILLCLGLALLLHYVKKKHLAKWILAYAFLFFLGSSSSPLPRLLVQWEEEKFPAFSESQLLTLRSDSVHIVVLGAGHSNAPNYFVHDRLSATALKRLLEGVRINDQLSRARLICSGYSKSGRQSQAEALAEMALTLKVSPQDTLLQPAATNTEKEAETYAQRFGPEIPLILVTSALHMPRAMFWFQYYGLNPIPAPTNYLVMIDPGYEPFAWKPSVRKIEMTQKLLHEYAGMLHAKWKTRRRQ